MPVPYDIDNIPEKLRKRLRDDHGLSEKGIRQFVHVFNSCWEKHHDKSTCYAQAYGVVNDRPEFKYKHESAAISQLIRTVVSRVVTNI